MGTPIDNKSMSLLSHALLFVLLATASAIPAEDAVVPESELYQAAESPQTEFEAVAADVQTLFTKGKSDADCRKLANDAKKAIKKDVSAAQAELNKQPDGSKCKTAGQKDVKRTKKLLDQAKKALAGAKKKHNAAKKAKLTFTVTLDQMTNHKWWKNTQKYTDAVKSRKEAKGAEEQALGSYKTAKEEYTKAVKAAAKKKKCCLCSTKKKYAKAFKDADKAYTANKKAWKKAHLTLCVLDGTPEAKCSVPSCPRVKSMLGTDAKAISDSSCKALTGCESGGSWKSGPGWCGGVYSNGKVGWTVGGCECSWPKSALPGKKFMEMPAAKKFCENVVAKSKDPNRWAGIDVNTGWK